MDAIGVVKIKLRRLNTWAKGRKGGINNRLRHKKRPNEPVDVGGA